MKKLFLIVAVAFFAISVNAQIKLGANLGLSLPTGDFADACKTGFGGSIMGKYAFSDKMAVGLNIGYYANKAKDGVGGSDVTFSYTPITASFQYFLGTEGFKPYVGADLGFYAAKFKVSSVSVSQTVFGFAPVVGFEYGLSESLSLDVNAKYHLVSKASDISDKAFNFVGINVGILYSLGK
ncbi:MAG: OmpW family outer membrane protein [Bacteroidota bacterium]|nr:OmpW family outer membrane protein [Bacteroidota bacterium]